MSIALDTAGEIPYSKDMNTTTDTTFDTIDQARAASLEASQADPSRYFWIANCFGWVVISANRLAVQTPSDGSDWSGQTGSYWKNGKERRFSEKQIIADQNATPMMS